MDWKLRRRSLRATHRPLSSSFFGILNINHKKGTTYRGLWVEASDPDPETAERLQNILPFPRAAEVESMLRAESVAMRTAGMLGLSVNLNSHSLHRYVGRNSGAPSRHDEWLDGT